MPVDHFVPQVHLREFCSPTSGDRLHAIRKLDLTHFTPSPRNVCGINDGSTNGFLRENRAIEQFLETIEPHYHSSLQLLTSGKASQRSIYTIAGFVAYVMSCSPGGMRIQSPLFRESVEVTAAILDARGQLPPSPPVLGGRTVTQLLSSGELRVDVDPKFPQAFGIAMIEQQVARFGNFAWDVLLNECEDSPFLTSDYPVAIEPTDDLSILNRLIPLSPRIALRIRPNRELDRGSADLSFSSFSSCVRHVGLEDVRRINRLIVRCAETTVFFRDDLPWIRPFIAKNRNYRIEMQIERIRVLRGYVSETRQRIVATSG